MKTLLILRHGKASSDLPIPDHDRPLTQRGQRQAAEVGRYVLQQNLLPDLIVSSTAHRARETATRVSDSCGYDGPVRENPDLYMAQITTLLKTVHDLPEATRRVMIVGHNPGLERFVGLLTGGAQSLSTASLAQIDLDAEPWRDMQLESRYLLRRMRHSPE